MNLFCGLTAEPVFAQNQAPSLGTVPGIYYDPSGELSPSLKEMGQASQAGVISYEQKDFDERYNLQRVWKRGATPDQIIKVGDIQNNPTLNKLIDLENLTLREIAANGGADIDLVPLHSIGLINSMTVEEFFEVFPELKNQSIKNVPILNVPIGAILTGNGAQIRERTLTDLELELIKNLAKNPANEGIPVEELVTGNWELVLREEAQQHLQDVLDKYPELRGLPADKLFPLVNGAIAGDWNSVVNQAQDYATKQGTEILTRELLEAVPALKDAPLGALPIDQLVVGDVPGLADIAIAYIPKIANKYLSQLGHLSQIPGTMLMADTAMILLTGDIFGRLDIAFAGDVETPITRVVTGGTLEQKFSPEPCLEESCKHFELVDVLSGNGEKGNVHSKAWIQGSSQSVPGGKGFLRWVNGGEERTGVPVWTTDAHVKLSLEDIDEGGNGEPATARVWLDFQLCVEPPFLGEHCTPHFFSFPTPWKVQEGGLMVVFSRASAPDIIDEIQDQIEPENRDYRNRCRGIECNTPIGTGIATGTLVNPAPGYRVTSGFGYRPPPCGGCSGYHPAVDLATPSNTPIQSADGGVVIASGWVKGYGHTVVIDHGNNVKTRYSHLNQINVAEGQKVSQGQTIALSGATGVGTGAHLDFGIYIYEGSGWTLPDTAIDPQSVIDFSR